MMASKVHLDNAFSRMCMVLDAPADLNPFFDVMAGVKEILGIALPSSWEVLDEVFGGWSAVADWALRNRERIEEDLRGYALQRTIKKTTKSGENILRPAMSGHNMIKNSVYAMLSGTHASSDHLASYALLRLQLLITRWKTLSSMDQDASDPVNIEFHVKNYESGEVSTPRLAAMESARRLADANWIALLNDLQPELPPEEFRASFRESSGSLPPELATHYANIRNYCQLKTPARSPRAKGWKRTGSYSRAYTEYTPTRVGHSFTEDDPDDVALYLGDQELIDQRGADPNDSLAHGVNPDEDTLGSGSVLLGDASGGSPPEQLAFARSRVSMIEIDKGVLPWSAIHLRSREIEGKLLSELAKASQSSTSDSDLNHIEEYALLAVMLETGRPLAQSIEIRYESSPTGNLGFIPAGSPCQSFWAWKTIEPLYRSEHDQVSEMEVTRPPYLFFPVHTVADRLLRLWNTLRLTREPQLFSRPLDQYREGIRSRLHSLDSTGRLTMIKIARLKWTIMSQINGGELAEASLVFGRPDPAVNVQLYYSLMPLKTTTRLFREATAALWGGDRRSLVQIGQNG